MCTDEKKDTETLRGQKQYTDAGVRTVVTTSAIAMNSDDEEEENEGSDSDSENHHIPLGVLATRDSSQNGAEVPGTGEGPATGRKQALTRQQKGKRSAVRPNLDSICNSCRSSPRFDYWHEAAPVHNPCPGYAHKLSV